MGLKRFILVFCILMVFSFRIECGENVSHSSQEILLSATIYSKKTSDATGTLPTGEELPRSSTILATPEVNSTFEEQSLPTDEKEQSFDDSAAAMLEVIRADRESKSELNKSSEDIHKIRVNGSLPEISTNSSGSEFNQTHSFYNPNDRSEKLTGKQDNDDSDSFFKEQDLTTDEDIMQSFDFDDLKDRPEQSFDDLAAEMSEAIRADRESKSELNKSSEDIHKVRVNGSLPEISTNISGSEFNLTHSFYNPNDRSEKLTGKQDEDSNVDYSRSDISHTPFFGETSQASSNQGNSQKPTETVITEKMNEWLKTKHERLPIITVPEVYTLTTTPSKRINELSDQNTSPETTFSQESIGKHKENKNEARNYLSHNVKVGRMKNSSEAQLNIMHKWLQQRIEKLPLGHLKLEHHMPGFPRGELGLEFEGRKVNQTISRNAAGTNVTLQLDINGETISICMDVLKTEFFTTKASVTVIDSETQTSTPISRIKHLNVYEGHVDTDNGSYVCGSLVQDTFNGVLMLSNGTVLYVEPQETLSPSNGGQQLVLYKGTDITYTNCSNMKNTNNTCEKVTLSRFHSCKRNGKKKIVCFESEKNSVESPYPLSSPIEDTLHKSTRRLRMEDLMNTTCVVELVSDHSHFVERHNRSILNTLRDLLVVVLQANRILSHLDLDSDGQPDHICLQIGHVAMFASSQDSDVKHEVMYHKLEAFRRRPQDYCMSLLFLSMSLPQEPVSIAFGSGICRSNENEKEPARNVALLNTIGSDGSRNLFTTSWITTKTIGQMMGSLERNCEEELTYPFEDDWSAFFSECRRHNMANMLQINGHCLEGGGELFYRSALFEKESEMKNSTLCGNGRVDEGEECDCGTASSCASRTSCCTRPGDEKQCTVDRSAGHECEWTDACCTMSCKIMPKSQNMFCGIGDPLCGPKDAYCDGTTSRCPVANYSASTFDGQPCGPALGENVGTGTCKNGYCHSTICIDAGFMDCHCDLSSEQNECRVCCKNSTKGTNGNCRLAEEFGLKSNTSGSIFQYPGTTCKTDPFGQCDRLGICTYKRSGICRLVPFHDLELSSGKLFPFILILGTTLWHYLVLKLF